jgi:transcription elongation factor GreA
MADGNFVYLTRERIVEIEKELLEMKTHGRKSMAEKIAEARSHGDLSENAEYDAAKEEQVCLNSKSQRWKMYFRVRG